MTRLFVSVLVNARNRKIESRTTKVQRQREQKKLIQVLVQGVSSH